MSAPLRHGKYPMLETALDRAIQATILVLTAFVMTAPVALLLIGWISGGLTY